jgi:UrcA family protein
MMVLTDSLITHQEKIMRQFTTQNVLKTVLVAGALIAALSTGANAADVAQVNVSFADLNISTPAGATVLYQRIRVAAAQVCGTTDQRDLARSAHSKPCTDKAIADAVAAVGNDALTDVYQAKNLKVTYAKLASN